MNGKKSAKVTKRVGELCDVLDKAAGVAQDIAQLMIENAPEDEETVMALSVQAQRRIHTEVVNPLSKLVGSSGGSVH